MFTINADLRNKCGKRASRQLRIHNKIPAIIYGNDIEPIPIIIDHNKIWNLYYKKNFINKVFKIILVNKEEIVTVHDVQRHAFKLKLVHIDFLRIK